MHLIPLKSNEVVISELVDSLDGNKAEMFQTCKDQIIEGHILK